MSLRQFVCFGLDLNYQKSLQSHEVLQRSQFQIATQAKHLRKFWTKIKDHQQQDLNIIYSERNIKSIGDFELKNVAPEDRHQRIQD